MANITKLGIVAGGGIIPRQVIDYCQTNSIPFFVIALKSHADENLVKDVPHIWARVGEAGKILDTLKQEQVTEVVLIGSVKRPSWSEIRPDWVGMKILANIAKKAFGDDSLLRLVISEFEKCGFKVIGVDKILPDMLAKRGVYGKISPDEQAMRDINHGFEIASTMGKLDVGQGVVMQNTIVLAVEAVEGTDAMIHRAGQIKREGTGPILIKVKKPQQEDRIDLPTIGTATVINAHEQGFSGIAIEAGGVLVINQQEVIKEADSRGMFIIGVKLS